MCNIPNPNHGGLNWASQNFDRRFNHGRADGSLVGGEVGLAGAGIQNYKQDLNAAKSDGVINPWERMNLRAERGAVSHLIYDLRHNGFGNQPSPGGPSPCPQPATDPFHPFGTRPATDPFHPFGTQSPAGPRPAVDPYRF